MAPERLVVIGNGMGGARLVEDILTYGRDRFEIVMFGDEPYGNYNRILLSNVLAGSHKPQDIFLNPLGWYEDNGIRLHAGVRVEAIDREAKRVRAAGGMEEPYDRLVLATGARPFVPPIEGLAGDTGQFKGGVFLFRTLDDSLRMTAYAQQSKKAVVIGGGLLGLEAARGLMNLGLEVHVVELASHVMAVQLDRDAGAILKRTMEGMGMRIHTGASVTALLGGSRAEGVVYADGSVETCDLLVISAGIRPNAELARNAGLEVDRGVVVGDDLASVTDPSIYAIGECASHRGCTYGLVAPVWEQAAVLAARLGGGDVHAAYTGSSTSTKLKVMGVDLLALGEKEAGTEADEVVTYADPAAGVYKKLVIRDGRLVGAILLGDPLGGPRLLEAFHRGGPLPACRAEILFPPAATPASPAAAEAPDAFQVCNCNGVSLGMIREAVGRGCRTLGAVCEATRAGTGCGACKPQVQAILEGASPRPAAETPDSFQVCNCNGVSKGMIREAVDRGCRTLGAVCEATRAGTGCGACKPQVRAILEAVSNGRLADDPTIHYYVPAIPLRKPELIAAIRRQELRSVSAVLEALGSGADDAKSKSGLASLLKTIWAGEYDDERDARFINDRVHANIQKDGTFSVVPRILGGVATPAQLRVIADVAEKYEARMIKITGGQRIDLLGIPKEQLPDVWRDLAMPSGHAYTKAFRTCKTCVGEEFCRFGLADSTGLGIEIEKTFQGLETPHKVKMAVSACPRNCAESTTKDVGLVAIGGGQWEVYIGGAAGSRVRKGDVLIVVDSHEEAIRYTGRFLQYYRENAKYLERTYDFVERIGLPELQRLLVEDAEGVSARLDQEIAASVAAYRDPWSEGDQPLHPLQFVDSLAPAGVAGGAR